MKSGTYLISFGRRCYVGSSVFLNRRWLQHRRQLGQGTHANRFMQRLWNKGERPSFSVLQYGEPQELIGLEQVWVNKLSPQLNIALVVTAPMLGRKHNITSCAKMSKSQLARTDNNKGWKSGRPLTEEHKQNVGLAQQHRKIVICIQLAKTFYSLGDAARYLMKVGRATNVSCRSNIRLACIGELKTAYGYKWQYLQGVE